MEYVLIGLYILCTVIGIIIGRITSMNAMKKYVSGDLIITKDIDGYYWTVSTDQSINSYVNKKYAIFVVKDLTQK